ncbi:hypothetical protein [Piscibacillus salipiscarius]|uniref:hypothetical protein n=1 Tax=Piscibacillus salipiscarius TaxID=299480 RepID=UPI00243635D5|nr:hypothetical protein [Piscibacillus salipiscarius]
MINIKKVALVLISLAWIVVGCTSQESEIQLPEDAPEFVEKSHFEEIDWENKAVRFQGNIIGNKNKSGVIGVDMPSVNQGQKWMWHLWGIEEPLAVDLTVVGMHKATKKYTKC